MSDKDSGNIVAFLAGLPVGGLAGAATVLLLTPQSGKGTAILVSREPRETRADGRLESPQAARRWLEHFLTKEIQ